MSLQVWLPLNGDLHNQGLSNITITNNGATINTSGKIGSCYSFDGTDDYISLTSSVLYDVIKGGTIPFSIAMWVYHADATRGILFGDYNLSGAINFNIELTAGHALRFYWAGSPDKNFTITVDASQWTHICLVYDGTQVLAYKNGIIQSDKYTGILATKTKTAGAYYLGRDSRTGTTAFNGKLNDFRIYDHALSAKEVEEIAKGLVLHYKLDNNGLGGENLFRETSMINKNNFVANSSTDWTKYFRYYNGSAAIHTLSNNEDTVTLNTSGNLGIAFTRKATDINLDANSYYTISCEAKCTKSGAGLDIGLSYYNNSNSWVWRGGTNRQLFTSVNTWQKFTLKFKPDSDTQYICYCFTVVGTSGGTDTFTIRHCKLEKGEIATRWSPAPADLGLDTSIVYDCSGYNNNGQIVGTLTATADTSKYEVSNVFDGNTSCVRFPFNSIVPHNIFTFNLWFKKDALGAKSYETLVGGLSGFEMDTRSGAATTLSLYMASKRGGNVFSPFSFGQWYMVTMVRDGTNELYYVNGELVKTITAQSMPTGQYWLGAWASNTGQNYYGKMSDFRIYITPLTGAQIKELYNTSMSIDNNGNIHARELVEL